MTGADPVHPLEAAYHALRGQFDLEIYGHHDFHESLAAFHASNVPTPYTRTRRWVALPAATDPEAEAVTAVGLGILSGSLEENRHAAYAMCYVDPAHRHQGIGRLLIRTLEAAAEEGGRTTIQVWLSSPDTCTTAISAPTTASLTTPTGAAPTAASSSTTPATAATPTTPTAAEIVPAKSGVGGVPGGTPGVRLLQRLGFELEQVESQSTLDIPAPGGRDEFLRRVSRWREEAGAVAGGDYETVSWRGVTPPERRAELARLRHRMSVDIPAAGLDVEEEVWTEERIQHMDDRTILAGFDLAYSIAVHRPTGAIAAYTFYEWPVEAPAGVWQSDTFVDREHRGHRLGMLLKAVNLEHLLELNPATARIHTWNAGENEHMLAINRAMGFTPRSVEGAWEKRRNGPGA